MLRRVKRPGNGLLGGLIFGPLFIVIGYFVAFMFGRPILDNARASAEWPSAPGTIKTSQVERSRSDGKTMYSCEIVYDYVVEGQKLEGDTVWFGGNYRSSSDGHLRDAVNRYPVGKQVKVFYNPQEPTVSVLETGAFFSSYLVFGIGIAFLVTGVLVTAGVALTILLGGLVIGTAVASGLSRTGQSPANQFAPPWPPSPRKTPQDETDDGIQVG